MSKETLRKLRDDERQTDIGREIIEKMMNGQEHFARWSPLFQPSPTADDDQRPVDTE